MERDGVDDLAQDRNMWWPLVNTVMNVRVPKKCGEFFV
jgi:hypothetical protein